MFLFFNLVEVGYDFCLNVMLICLLVDLHYGKFLGKARDNIVVGIYQIFCGKLGFLNYANQVLFLSQLLLETHLNRFLNNSHCSLPQYPFLPFGLQSIVVVLYHPHRHLHGLRLLFRKFDAI